MLGYWLRKRDTYCDRWFNTKINEKSEEKHGKKTETNAYCDRWLSNKDAYLRSLAQ
jgi:hypothetical protein